LVFDMEVMVKLPPPVEGLVARGVLTVSVYLSSDGQDVWFRATKSHPELGVRTNDSLSLEDTIRLFGPDSKFAGKEQKTVWAPRVASLGSYVSPLPFRGTAPPEPNPDVVVTTYEQALQRSKLKNLNVVIRNGCANSLPKDSLSWWDLGREDYDDFAARAFLVARAIGEVKAASRVASVPELHVRGAAALDDWWFRATADQKWALLSSAKKRGETPKTSLEGLSSRYRKRFELLQCPFRNSPLNLEKQTTKEESDSGEEDPYDYTYGSSI
jgi:hypothetical protein